MNPKTCPHPEHTRPFCGECHSAEVEWLDGRIALVRDVALRALIEPSSVGKQIALEQIYQSLLGVSRTTSAKRDDDA